MSSGYRLHKNFILVGPCIIMTQHFSVYSSTILNDLIHPASTMHRSTRWRHILWNNLMTCVIFWKLVTFDFVQVSDLHVHRNARARPVLAVIVQTVASRSMSSHCVNRWGPERGTVGQCDWWVCGQVDSAERNFRQQIVGTRCKRRNVACQVCNHHYTRTVFIVLSSMAQNICMSSHWVLWVKVSQRQVDAIL